MYLRERMRCLPTILLLCVLPAFAPAQAKQKSSPPRTVTETVEWTWAQRPVAPNPALPNVLLLGDSITRGYYPEVTQKLAGRANCYLFATSAASGDPAIGWSASRLLPHGGGAVQGHPLQQRNAWVGLHRSAICGRVAGTAGGSSTGCARRQIDMGKHHAGTERFPHGRRDQCAHPGLQRSRRQVNACQAHSHRQSVHIDGGARQPA